MTENAGIKTDHNLLRTFEEHESAVRSYGRNFPVVVDRARGAQIEASDGRRFLDFLTGCSSLNYGHNPEPLKRALLEYIERDGVAHSLDLYSVAKQQFLLAFQREILEPRKLKYRVQFPGPTGANAVEAALKLARKVTGRENIVAFTNGFHGVTLGALACTGNEHHRGGAGIALQGVTRLPYAGYLGADFDSLAYLERVLGDPSSGVDKPAAVIIETVQGEGGLNCASHDWLRRIARIARQHGALLIVDDIQAGVGRTGTFFSFEQAGIRPDIVTLAKSISGYGLPMSLVLIAPEHDEWLPGEHNGTFRGNCHAFVTARAAIEHYWQDPQFTQQIAKNAAYLESGLRAIADRHRALKPRLKGRGLMRGIQMESGDRAAAITAAAFRDGLIIETSGPYSEVVKLLPPINIAREELEQGLSILDRAMAVVAKSDSRAAA